MGKKKKFINQIKLVTGGQNNVEAMYIYVSCLSSSLFQALIVATVDFSTAVLSIPFVSQYQSVMVGK